MGGATVSPGTGAGVGTAISAFFLGGCSSTLLIYTDEPNSDDVETLNLADNDACSKCINSRGTRAILKQSAAQRQLAARPFGPKRQ